MKKAQVALEFLLTYGWAILVVLIVISALVYFNILNPEKLLPTPTQVPATPASQCRATFGMDLYDRNGNFVKCDCPANTTFDNIKGCE